LEGVGRHREIHFANADRLAVEMLNSKLLDVLVAAGVVIKPVNLPHASIGGVFKGRKTMLGKLNRSFGAVPDNPDVPAIARVLNGLGGVGKTRLALEYAWMRAGEYRAMLFVTADSLEVLQRQLAALCGPFILNLPEQGEADQEKQRNAVMAWLRRHPGWLLVLDNIDSEEGAEAVEALLPQLVGGHVLLTSRLANWSSNISALPPLDVLSPEAATDFLLARTTGRRRSQPDDTAVAGILADKFGCLALALEQAGAYIAKHRLSFTRYLEEWQHQRDKVLDWFDPRLMHYPKSVAITWQTSFEHLGEPAKLLLQRLSWLAPEPIPESLLEVAVPDAAETDAFAALAELESYSLATRAADTPAFSVHRMVQEVTRRRQREDSTGTLLEALRWLDAAFVGNPQDSRTWPVLIPLAPHLRAVAAVADANGIVDAIARLLNQLALLYDSQGRYTQAKPLYERALAIREKILGPDHPDVAEGLNNLAALYYLQGQYAQAEPLYQRSLAIWEEALGVNHVNVALSLNNLAELYRNRHKYAQAKPLHERALGIWEKAFSANHPNVASSLNNLADLYRIQGQYAQAEPFYQRSLAIWEEALGPNHPNVATSLENMAALYRESGKEEEAAALDERAAATRAQNG
jgi:tetratricopeptide (TPR) repeat protein